MRPNKYLPPEVGDVAPAIERQWWLVDAEGLPRPVNRRVLADTLDPRVKLGMAKALWNLNKTNKGKGRDVMLAFLESTDPDLRAEGALALGEIGMDQAKPILRELQVTNRTEAVMALVERGWVAP